MATLTTKARKRLPAREFAGPDRSYPIPDREHAANAKARATQQWVKGKLSTEEHERILRAANRKLRES